MTVKHIIEQWQIRRNLQIQKSVECFNTNLWIIKLLHGQCWRFRRNRRCIDTSQFNLIAGFASIVQVPKSITSLALGIRPATILPGAFWVVTSWLILGKLLVPSWFIIKQNVLKLKQEISICIVYLEIASALTLGTRYGLHVTLFCD